MPTLIIKESGKDEPRLHRCLENDISIGRLDTNTIHLPSGGVSRNHARIIQDGENFFLIDLDSGNGTFINGLKLNPNEKNLLQAGDIITIDDYQINFHSESDVFEGDIPEETTGSDILEVKLLKKVLNALDKETVPSIEVLNGSAEGKKFYFTDEIEEITIGRDPECDFPVNEYIISRRHAKITKRWGGIAIRDLESKNGTYLNNRRVIEEYLHDGDRVALGTIVFLFRNPQEINLANIEDIRPKNIPAPVEPQDIPGIEEPPKSAEALEAEPEIPPTEEAAEGEAQGEGFEKNIPAIEEWNQLEEEEAREGYPVPQAKIEKIKTLTPIEIGMIGLGILVLIFALITIVNLLAS